MNPHIPGHEPDAHDMKTGLMTDPTRPASGSGDPDVGDDDELNKLGDFA
jgi:hypothetical protein